jgi:hypothetical protein
VKNWRREIKISLWKKWIEGGKKLELNLEKKESIKDAWHVCTVSGAYNTKLSHKQNKNPAAITSFHKII